MHEQYKVIVEIVNELVVSLWANHEINFEISPTQEGYTIHGEAEVRLWFSADPEMPQYDPVAEGMTKYYPL